MIRTALPLLALCIALPAQAAGPIERRMNSLGANVPVPGKRPLGPIEKFNAMDPAAKAGVLSTREIPTPEPKPVPAPPPPETAGPDPLIGPDPEVAGKKLADASCIEALRKIADVRAADQPDAKDKACRIDEPVILNATKGAFPVRYSDDLRLSCAFATRLVNFTTETLQPLARHHIGARLTSLKSGQGFVCRRRNNAPTGKLSEHAFGAAIDIVAFDFDGRSSLPVRDSSDMSQKRAAFFSAARTAACGTFTTVLGPGSDAAHATHLHFDTARMDSGKKNPYRICE